jgi:hypothetical protein
MKKIDRYTVKFDNLVIDTESNDSAIYMAYAPKDAKVIARLMSRLDRAEKEIEDLARAIRARSR